MTVTKGKYKTRSGHVAHIHEIVLYNSAGERTTFPAKGVVLRDRSKHGGKLKTPCFTVWTLEGRFNTFSESKLDLIERIE